MAGAKRVELIRGSGVDTEHFVPLPEPKGEAVTVALVGRMLRSKGVLDAAGAVRLLRSRGVAVASLTKASSCSSMGSAPMPMPQA